MVSVAWPGPEIDDAFANRDACALPAIEDGSVAKPDAEDRAGPIPVCECQGDNRVPWKGEMECWSVRRSTFFFYRGFHG